MNGSRYPGIADPVGQLAWWVDRAEHLRLDTERLRAALHLAYDWMGREPSDSWDQAHFNLAEEQVAEALKVTGS